MKDEHVDLLDAQLAGTLFKAVQRLLIAVVVDPDLGLDENLRPLDPRSPDRLSHAAFVSIRRGGVDMAVTDAQRFSDRCLGLIGWRLEHAKSQRGHRDTIVQGKVGYRHFSFSCSETSPWSDMVPRCCDC